MNMVELEERACTAKVDDEVAIDESKMVRTLGKDSDVNARGETVEKHRC
jgi:hypothetical protein